MYTHPHVSRLLLFSTLAALCIPSPAIGQHSTPLWNVDQGTSECEWSTTKKPPVEQITFTWSPELDPLTTLYFAQAKCAVDSKKARNKVLFENVQLTGLAGDTTVRVAKVAQTIRSGEERSAVWDLTPVLGELPMDDTVLVSGEVRTKKQLKAHQAMTCSLAVWELFDANDLRLATKSERLGHFRDFIETMGRARRLPVVLQTGQSERYATGDDGHLQMGASWPKPRFTDNGNGTVTDNLTGLIWLEDANCFEDKMPWDDALARSNALFDGCTTCGRNSGDCGLSDGSVAGDWRLPNRFELESLLDLGFWDPALSNAAGTAQWVEGDPFLDVQSFDDATYPHSYYWSSTTTVWDPVLAWWVNPHSGDTWIAWKTHDLWVWPVRGGQ